MTTDIEPQEVGHVVLKVRDIERSTAFYQDVLGFKKVGEIPGRMAFFTATGANHHDLAVMSVGADAPTPPTNAEAWPSAPTCTLLVSTS